MEYTGCGAWVVGVVVLLVASASAYVPISAGTAYGGLTVAAGGRSRVAWCSGMSCFPTCSCILRTTKVAGGGRQVFAQRLQASAAGGDDTDSFDITKMTLEEMEALPELGEGTSGDSSDRAPMLEEIMADDVRFGMKMRALRGDFAPQDAAKDTECGLSLAETLMTFPGTVEMRVVLKPAGNKQAVPQLLELLDAVSGVKVISHTQKERMNGKYVTLDLQCLIQSALARESAFKALASDTRVAMKF
eukprot:CAMPEP_0179414874 /NCGR_PEP_ID=MMETSP0799-20121207/5920_1 /TAXON_ID=46947 /ORGANISM="Geminigera cryophila, Strain CCMP2564" /LENGTH=245 /DNA_ID=CAMNT_0021187553 /DNA_START=61 /DNA_END=798 /DNA_ORIENTATION=+